MNDDFIGIDDAVPVPAREDRARQGPPVIVPARFTHTRKGHVATSGDKYGAASRVLYRRAEDLFS